MMEMTVRLPVEQGRIEALAAVQQVSISLLESLSIFLNSTLQDHFADLS